MATKQEIPRKLIVAVHPDIAEAFELASEITDYLAGRGLDASFGSLYERRIRSRVKNSEFDLMIALGGDGTMLRAGHLCAPNGLPILGINFGRLGFLIEVDRGHWKQAFEQLLEGDYWLENRMMLRAQHIRAGKVLGEWDVLNECVVGRSAVMRPIRIETEINGRHMTTYVADALIAATSTGSTAYALAAGGPIMPPELRNILLVPVAPHLSVDRAVILHEGSSVRITVHTDNDAILSADGQPSVYIDNDDQVHITAGRYSAQFVRFQDPGYFYRNLTSRMQKHPAAGNSE